MKKRLLSVIAVLTILIIVSSCSDNGEKEAALVLKKYLSAFLYEKYDQSYRLISNEDCQIKSIAVYNTENKNPDGIFIENFMYKIRFEIKSLKSDGKKAQASVLVSVPDAVRIAGNVMGTSFLPRTNDMDVRNKKRDELVKKFNSKSLKQQKQLIADNYLDQTVPMKSILRKYILVNENGQWKLFLDWKTEVALKVKKEKINLLLDAARTDVKERQFQEALIKYDQIVALDDKVDGIEKEMANVIKQIEKLDEKERVDEIKQLYMEKMSIQDVVVNGVKLSGNLINNGQRELFFVKITVYLLDENDKKVAGENFRPVYVSPLGFGSDQNPSLKGGETRRFEYEIDENYSDLWNGKVRLELANIRFAPE